MNSRAASAARRLVVEQRVTRVRKRENARGGKRVDELERAGERHLRVVLAVEDERRDRDARGVRSNVDRQRLALRPVHERVEVPAAAQKRPGRPRRPREERPADPEEVRDCCARSARGRSGTRRLRRRAPPSRSKIATDRSGTTRATAPASTSFAASAGSRAATRSAIIAPHPWPSSTGRSIPSRWQKAITSASTCRGSSARGPSGRFGRGRAGRGRRPAPTVDEARPEPLLVRRVVEARPRVEDHDRRHLLEPSRRARAASRRRRRRRAARRRPRRAFRPSRATPRGRRRSSRATTGSRARRGTRGR